MKSEDGAFYFKNNIGWLVANTKCEMEIVEGDLSKHGVFFEE